MRYGLKIVLMIETMSTWYMMLRCPDLDHVSGQAREASKMLSRWGVWQELILRGVGNFFLAGGIDY